MVGLNEAVDALKAAAAALDVSGKELGKLLAFLFAMPELHRDIMPIGVDNEAIVEFMRCMYENFVLNAEASGRKQVVIEYEPPGGPTLKGFKSQEDLEKWLLQKKFLGLLPWENGPVVDEWEQLVQGESYKPYTFDSIHSRRSSPAHRSLKP